MVFYIRIYAMAAFSRGFQSIVPREKFTYSQYLKFSTACIAQSGHNRWSKIKHDKGAKDMNKNIQRSMFSREIALASKRELCSADSAEFAC
jgi:hypothetical protein